MTSRELFNGIMQAMNTHGIQVAALAEQNERIEKKIDGLYPRSNLPMIARPVQGVDYARTCNVAEYVDKKIKAHNDNVPKNAPRYLEFAANRTHDDLNRSALTTMGGIIARKFGDDYGGCKTWEKLHKIRPKACEEVIEESRARPEFHVFSQVDGQWCLREFAKNKIKSLFRTSRTQRQNGNGQNNGQRENEDQSNPNISAALQTQTNNAPTGVQGIGNDPSSALPSDRVQQNLESSNREDPDTGQIRNSATVRDDVRNTVPDREHVTTQETNVPPLNGSGQIRVSREMGSESMNTASEHNDVIRANTVPVTKATNHTQRSGGMSSEMQIAHVTVRNQSAAASQPSTPRRRTRAPRSGLTSRNFRRRRE